MQWNPSASDGNTFAAATSGRLTGSTRLYDVRSCFSSDSDRPLTSKDAVLNFHTALMQNSSTRGLIAAAAETNSLCFDPDGRSWPRASRATILRSTASTIRIRC